MSNLVQTKQFQTFTWIDITSPTQAGLSKLSKTHGIDKNHIKDSLQHGHLPKVERLAGYNFLLLRAHVAKPEIRVNNVGDLSNKISMYYKSDFLITIHRKPFPFLQYIEGDYSDPELLVLEIGEQVLQSFEQPVREQSDYIDMLEESLFLKKTTQISMEELYYQRSRARISKKLLLFTQTTLHQLKIKEEHNVQLQDLKDTLQDLLLWYEEILDDANNLLSTFLSVNSKRTNDIMKLLTVFSAFFLPLTFIVGVYGMNFSHMPELSWSWGYPLVLFLMVGVCLVIYFWFKRKGIL